MDNMHSALGLLWTGFFIICGVISSILTISPADSGSMLIIWLIVWMIFTFIIIGSFTVAFVLENIFHYTEAANILYWIFHATSIVISIAWNCVACWLLITEDNIHRDSKELWALTLSLVCLYFILIMLLSCLACIQCYAQRLSSYE